MSNELWYFQRGQIAGYTENRSLMRRIARYKYKKGWQVMAEYYDSHNDGKLKALQYRIPIEQRRAAERMFEVKMTD